jgi:hypothetical protein
VVLRKLLFEHSLAEPWLVPRDFFAVNPGLGRNLAIGDIRNFHDRYVAGIKPV